MLAEKILICNNGNETGYKELYNSKGDYLSTVTNRYVPVEHERIEGMARDSLVKMGIDFEFKDITYKSGRDCFMKFMLNGFDEQVKPQIVLFNTYKSGKAMKLITGAFTKVCGNGTVIGTRYSTFSHSHFKELQDGVFIDSITKFVESYPKHLEFLNTLEQKEANLDGLFLNWGQSERDEKNIRQMFGNRKTDTATENRKGSSNRDLYETVTEYYSHSKINEGAKIEKLSYIQNKFRDLVLA